MPSDDISTLQNVFPNIPHDIIETILESNLGDVDKAFDNLLEMSDPDFGHQTNNTSDRSSTAPPALPRPRVSFQEPERTNVQSTINHWSADPNAYRRSSSQEEDQIKKDAELARRLAAEEQQSGPTQPPHSTPVAPNASWTNPRMQPPPIFGTPPPARPYPNPYSSTPQPLTNPFSIQELKDQIPFIRQNAIEQGNIARQKAKELYKQLKTKNMAKVNDFGNGVPNATYSHQSNNPFTASQSHYPAANPRLPPRPVNNRPGTSSEQIRSDEEYARRLSSQQYQAIQPRPQSQSQSQHGANVGSAQSALEPVEAARGSINPFQDEFGEDDQDPPPYESHRNDRLVPQ